MEGSGQGEGEGRVRSGDGAARRQIPVAASEVAGHGASVAGQGAAAGGVEGHGAGVAGAAGVVAQHQPVVWRQTTALAGVSSLIAAGAFPGAWPGVAAPGARPGGAGDDCCASIGSCDNFGGDEEDEEEDEDDSESDEDDRRETSGPSIEYVMQLVKECGATYGTNEHFIATCILTKRAEREMFLTMDAPEERFQWLKMKYEWMNRNNVAK